MNNLSLLGSTGSIGTQTLEVVRHLNRLGEVPVTIKTLAAHSDIGQLEEQIREFKPEAAAVFDEEAAKNLRVRVRDLDVKILSGIEGICEAAAWHSADITLNSVVGMVGLRPTMAAIQAGKTLALANKETLVAGGSLVMEAAKANKVQILPVDSEHSAVFQCLQGCNEKSELKKIILTASGGPFFGKSIDELKQVTPSMALKHPNWDMGAKITIDSATMMNKGLEVIEAKWLFDMPPEAIEVVVHRESMIHSLIAYNDNAVIAQLGLPNMQIPIQYALTYPKRLPSPCPEMHLWEIGTFSFAKPDYDTFRCLALCLEAIKIGGTAPAVANAANEVAVDLFLKEKIGFLDIPELVEAALNSHKAISASSLETVYEADESAREFVRQTVAHG
ncbi:1-deoxy-D-xylulose-5-phosphate reductoisomerase [Scatolibacter rhodanostii]|uniref:1-deoxy-D-xylulose-5-phosphate reductoisomerase n=1 Tax=Scatolibacter rhodanostii TaxID=2014781 RepID=UPI00190E96FA|nr:1-deoxy-D-xylulose-5-phosphate reductoisomerase [Scatolibacter rhodanostii]